MITIKAKYARTFFEKSIGLLGKIIIQPLFLQTRWGIHTFGMHEAIDIIILDKQTVVAWKERLQPNHIFLWNPKYKDVLELPKGSIQKLHIHQGVQIKVLA
jgi:uncharacterized membrane protein (UPF0127 family)